MIKIAPSILSADFCNLERDLREIDNADFAHIDVMDNHFVPNLTIGQPVVQRIIELGVLPSDVHLMIENPDRWAIDFAKLGADSITFHLNAASAPLRLARELRSMGAKASIAVRPAESVESLFDIIDEFDMILVMTVEPGFGGQKFLSNQMNKVTKLREFVEKNGLRDKVTIQVDGGISKDTIETVAKAGANCMVAGSAVYSQNDRKAEIELLRALGSAAFKNAWG